MAGLRDALAEAVPVRIAVALDDGDRVDMSCQGGDGQHPGQPAADHDRGAPALGVPCHVRLAPPSARPASGGPLVLSPAPVTLPESVRRAPA
ncbi:hypothetical protein HOK021_48520 [Streptomyces hygroscopicus]|nr:hypothetical protein HOK021_48520 [Streptomyces hygroscopicus]